MFRFRIRRVFLLGIFLIFSLCFFYFFTTSNVSFIDQSCNTKNIVFLKTHKTAGSSIQNIFLRYAFKNDLLVVLPKEGSSNYIGHPEKFSSKMVPKAQPGYEYNVFSHHTRFSYTAIRDFMPKGTLFVTILREPSAVFESLYIFYDFLAFFQMSLEEYVTASPTDFLEHHNQRDHGRVGRNQMAFDLGLASWQFDNETGVLNSVIQLDKQFDLVMIAELMDESLVLLKDLMCWTVDDIIVFRQNARQDQYRVSLTTKMKADILKWNKADKILYDYFYQRFTDQVAAFGKSKMTKEVKELKEKTRAMYDHCVAQEVDARHVKGGIYRPFSDLVLGFQLKDDSSATCENLIKAEIPFTSQIKRKQRKWVEKS